MKLDPGLGRSPAFLDVLLSCVQHVLLVVDTAGKIQYANPVVSQLFGYLPDELAGKDLSTLFAPEDLTFLYPNLLHLAGKGEPFEGEIVFLRKDESPFLAFVVFKPFRTDPDDKPVTLVSVQIIDTLAAEGMPFNPSHCKELVKLADGIAHEMRNPVAAIGGFARRLRDADAPARREEHYEGMMESLRRLEGLVEKVELFARLPKPCLKPVSPKELIERIVSAYEQAADRRGITLHAELQEATLFLDKALSSRAIAILIENAMDAVAKQDQITVRGVLDDNEYRISVSDTGCGISPKDLPRIFDPFFRTKPGGVGIDLTVLKRIVEGQAGNVEVASQPGRGTTFTLRFPIERRRTVRTCRFET